MKAAGCWYGVIGAVALLSWFSASAGPVYKCKQADGSVTFSDVSCPDDTISREHAGESRKWVAPQDSLERDADYGDVVHDASGQDLYPISEQVRKLRGESQLPRGGNESVPRSLPAATPVQPVMTYEEARRRAVKDAGYRNYGNLTGSQRERVHREMAKYNYSSPSQLDHSVISQQQAEMERLRLERETEQQRIREAEWSYEREKQYQQAGVPGRDYQYQEAVRNCRDTFMAECK